MQAEDFYRPLHGQIFSSIIALAHAGEPVDYVTVQAKLQERGAIAVELALLSSLQMNTPSAANAQHYAELVREKAQQRRLISVAGEIVDDAYVATDDVVGLIDEAERKINAIGDDRKTDSVSPLQRLLLSEADILEERGETRGQFNGLETGYKSLDQILQGLQPSSMTIVGARPATGKTAFALGILIHVGAVVKRPALFFSLEMSRQELAETDSRLDRAHRLVEAAHRRPQRSRLEPRARGLRVSAVGQGLHRRQPEPDGHGRAGSRAANQAAKRRPRSRHHRLPAVDEFSRGRAENRQVEVSEMSRSLKILARELQCPVIALSQLSRKLEERADKRPMMSDLRESGSLEQDADVVLFIFRPEQYGEVANDKKAEAEIIVGKNRNGPTRTAHLTWRGEFARFDNVADAREI